MKFLCVRWIIFLIFTLFLITGELKASDNFLFSHLTMENGLSNNSVFKILQDSRGYMWFATFSGLNRYDGSHFHVYRPKPGFPDTISNSVIFDIFEDSDGVIWIGTDGGGLNRYNVETNSFTSFRKIPGKTSGIGSNQVYAIAEDEEGFLWIGTDGGGISVINRKTMSFVRFTAENTENGLQSNTIRCLYRDSKKVMWVGTEGGGLSMFNKLTGKFCTYRLASTPESLPSDTVRVLYEDSFDRLWVGTEGGGLALFNKEKETFSRIDLRKTVSVRAISEDSLGRIWIGTEGNGIFVIHGKDYTHIISNRRRKNALSHSKIRSIYSDNTGLIWIGTRGGGVNKYNIFSSLFDSFTDHDNGNGALSNTQIRQIYQDSSGKILICTDGGGINILKNNNITEVISAKRGGISNNHVYAVIEDKDGSYWIGTDGGGLNHYNPKTGQNKIYIHNPNDPAGISSNVIWCLLKDSSDTLWIGTEGGGLNRYEPKTDSFSVFHYDPDDSQSLNGSSVRTIFEDSKQRLWIGTWDGGVSIYRGEGTFSQISRDPEDPESLSNISINCITEDSHNRIWIGTAGGGLNLYKEKKQKFIHYTQKEGLAGDNILGVLPGENDELWITTDSGLSRFYPNTELSINFTIDDGLLQNEYTRYAYMKSRSGKIYLGGRQGLTSFNPDLIEPVKNSVDVVFTTIDILDPKAPSESDYKRDPYLHVWPYGTERVEVPPNSLLTIAFSLLDFSGNKKNTYYMMLDRYYSVWQPLGTKQSVTFSNLPTGEYRLTVKAVNSKGVTSNNIAEMDIYVMPAFYETWWFYTCMAALFLITVFSLYKIRTYNLKKQNRTLREYATYIVEAREEERKYVAREVHDELGQIMTVLKMDLFWLRSHLHERKELIKQKISDALDLSNVSLESIKRLSSRIRPSIIDNLSLVKAIQWLVSDFSKHTTDIEYSVTVNGVSFEIDSETRTTIFRIIQELLTNIVRHSKANLVSVTISFATDSIILKVEDNGVGIEKQNINSPTSFGLIGVRERCDSIHATITIHSKKLYGTTIVIVVPYINRIGENGHEKFSTAHSDDC